MGDGNSAATGKAIAIADDQTYQVPLIHFPDLLSAIDIPQLWIRRLRQGDAAVLPKTLSRAGSDHHEPARSDDERLLNEEIDRGSVRQTGAGEHLDETRVLAERVETRIDAQERQGPTHLLMASEHQVIEGCLVLAELSLPDGKNSRTRQVLFNVEAPVRFEVDKIALRLPAADERSRALSAAAGSVA